MVPRIFMYRYPRIDETHSHCVECGKAFRDVSLSDGVCEGCIPKAREKREKALEGAEDRVLAKGVKASARLLSNLKSQGKESASMPVMLQAFFDEVGGESAWGELVGKHFMKAHGEGLDPAERETWKYSPKIVLQWNQLMSSVVGKNDSDKALDISSLEEGDLDAILLDLSIKHLKSDPELRRMVLYMSIQEDPDFRRLAFEESIKEEPELVERLLIENGVRTVEGKVTPQEPDDEDYDPTEDEWNGQ